MVATAVISFSVGLKCGGAQPYSSGGQVVQSKEQSVNSLSHATEKSRPRVRSDKHSDSSGSGDGRTNISDPAFDEDPRQMYAVTNLAAEFAQLASAAESGDLIAARTLLNRLETCSRAPRTAAALQRKKEKIRSPDYTYKDQPGGIPAALRQQDSLYQHCGELTEEQSESQSQWVEQLADAGDTAARLLFPFIAQPHEFDRVDVDQRQERFVEQAKAYLNAEIASGNGAALGTMAHAYMRPVISGSSTPFQLDPAMAYRYSYAYAQTPEGQSAVAYIKSPTYEGMVDLASNTLIRLESQLTAEQIADERREANAILKACCS